MHNPGVESQASRARRFVKRGKYRRIQRKKLRGKVKLTTNYSDYPLSLAQERVLNRGLNFCPQPTAVNRTKVEAGLKRMARIICWQGCISCGTCSYPELTEDHVLTSAYVKIFRIVTRNAVNKSF